MTLKLDGPGPAASFAERFPNPGAIWTPAWAQVRRRLLAEGFTNPEIQRSLAAGGRLPDGYGPAMDERLVEWPWVLANGPRGRTLDAGSALNHAEVLTHLAPKLDDLHIVTLEPEEHAFTTARISYVFADLRELPYRDGWFDTVVSVSTLEHVGMNNQRYGVRDQRVEVPDDELARALRELRRVARRDGRLLVTVPYGRPDDLGWFRVFDRAGVERMIDVVDPADAAVAVYRYDAAGWQVSDLDGAADRVYRDETAEPQPADLAPNARAIACLRLQL